MKKPNASSINVTAASKLRQQFTSGLRSHHGIAGLFEGVTRPAVGFTILSSRPSTVLPGKDMPIRVLL